MSFLDDESATAGQISLGTRRLGLDSLLPRRRRQAAQQQQASGYDILPSTMQPIPGVVSTPTDIGQVGVGQQLQQQETTAAQVPNVFERYPEGAAPIGDIRRYLYPTPPTEEDEEEDDVIEAANEEFAGNFGFDPYDPATAMGQLNLNQQAEMEAAAAQEYAILGGRALPLSQAAKAAYASAKHSITGGKSGQAYLDGVFNYSLTGDVNTPPTAEQINESEFGPQSGGYGTPGAPGYTAPTAPAAQGGGGPGGAAGAASIASGGDGGSSSVSVGGGGGGGGGGGSAPTTTVPPTTVPPSTVPPTAPVNQAPPATLPSNNSGGSNNNSVRQPSLGQPMPPIAENTPRIAALTRAVGNAVTFRVKARPGATVNIYRNGILVSSVPWSAALALKVTDNPSGENSYQVVVVGKNGKISISSKTTIVTKLNSRAGNKRDSKNNRVVAPKKSVKGKAVAPKKSVKGKAVAPKKSTLQSKASTNKSSK